MKTIGDLLTRDLDRRIEEVIQVDQADEQAVYEEITEYIATDSIKQQYADLLKAIADAPAEKHESVGVWVSGFFGSGKSSFAKNLGYALQNPVVCGEQYAELFKKSIESERVGDLLDLITTQYPTEVILFEVAKERDTRKVTERIAELMYTVLLRELNYAEDFDVAELEIELESEGKLEEFISTCQKLHGKEWEIVRIGAQKLSRASAVLHALDRKTYPSADSWSHAQRSQEAAITVKKVVERTFELMARRRPGKALVFIIDEVGQHVARSGDKIEDLRATVEDFGKEAKRLLKEQKIKAPCWIVVTSQEKLDEVVSAIDDKRIRLATMQDRFRYRIDLAPSDIREVATKRVLNKKEEAGPVLKKWFNDNQGALNSALRLERTQRKSEIKENDFVQFYPYPPHYIDICIGIMSGVRLQPGAPRHYGGSNRTIIKQAYEMLVSERTNMAARPIGTLVTLDKVFELVEGNLSSEKQTDIYNISETFKDDPEGTWCLRVAKVVCLLEFLRDLPRTEANIAAFLVDQVGGHAPMDEVKAAVKKLQQAQFVRKTDDGWKLQTAQEKNWDTERRSYLEPKPRERNEISRNVLRDVFGEAAYKTYRYKDLKTFRVGISVDGVQIGDEGDLPLSLSVADDDADLVKTITEVTDDSRQKAHENDIYWCFALTPDIDDLVAELHASRKMVEKYDQLRAQNKITSEEATTLQDEKNAAIGHQSRLRDKLTEAMEKGCGIFRGMKWDASDFGKNLPEILKKLFGKVVPDLYGKLELGSRPLKGNEAEEILKAHDLKALPQVFYAGDKGLGLVVKDGANHVVDPTADIAKEVLDFLVGEHNYGQKDSRMGKALEKRFGGLGYGWDRDMLCLVLATLFRANTIEVTHSGQKYDSYADPRCRPCFTKAPAFRSSLFTPIKPPDLKSLTRAVESYEELTGGTVDVEKNAIAKSLKDFADDEFKLVLPIKAQAEANKLPVSGVIQDYSDSLSTISSGTAEDCVNILAGEGASLKEARERIRRIGDCLDEKGLATIRLARTACGDMWSALQARGNAELADTVEELKSALASEAFYESLKEIGTSAKAVAEAYQSLYKQVHDNRTGQYQAAIEKIKGRPEWNEVPENMREPVLAPLSTRCCTDLDLKEGGLVCITCRANLGQMESDIAALGGLFANAIAQVQKLTTPPETKIERVRVAEFFTGSIETEDQVRQSVERLQDHLLKLLDEGVKIVLE